MDTIFSMFTRGSTDKEGLGIGLGVVSRIIDLHFGHVSAEKSSLGGTRFTFTLPLSPVQGEGSESAGHLESDSDYSREFR